MLVTEPIWQLLTGVTEHEITETRYGSLRADLEAFVVERDLYPKYLFWLTPRPNLIWEIRSVEEVPSLRVLGRFADFDTFIALTIEERSELEGWMSLAWKRAQRTCAQRWLTLFQAYQPHVGGCADDFFSGAIPGEYFKK